MINETKHQANPLEQFVLLAKSAKGAAAAELIKQSLDCPGVYVFSELMDMPNIKELAVGEFKSYWDLLNVFAYGTCQDYVANESNLPTLTLNQKKKLQYLTIVTLSQKGKCIPYDTLLKELGVVNLRELEDLIIEAIYAEIIQGKLDQSRGLLEVDTTIGRDIRIEEISVITSTLETWCEACENVLVTLQNQVDRANTEKSQKIQRRDMLEQEIASLKKAVKTQNQDSEEMITDSREALAADKTPKKNIKKGLRSSSSRILGFNK